MYSRLADTTPERGERFYLDTNVLMALAYCGEQKRFRLGKKEAETQSRRANLVRDFFLNRGAVPVTTLLAFEELAAVMRNGFLDVEAKMHAVGAGQSTFRNWKRSDPVSAHAAQERASNLVECYIQSALRGIAEIGGSVDRSEVPTGQGRPMAKKLRQAHQKLMQAYPRLDPMDALHIALAAEMGIDRVVSFDRAWQDVEQVTVYGEA